MSFTLEAAAAGRREVVAVFEIQTKRMRLKRKQVQFLTGIMADELSLGGVFMVMPPGEIKRELLKTSTSSYKKCYDEKCQIELGRQLPANKLLTTTVTKISGRCRLTSSLYDLRSQTTDVTEKAKGGCKEADLVQSIEKVAEKIRKWRSGGSGAPAPKPAGQLVIAQFKSTPEGAVVLVDGNMVCSKTPCSRSLTAGTHKISMQREKYLPKSQAVAIAAGSQVSWELEPDFGWLTIRTVPSGIQASVDGQPAGKTPVTKKELSVGNHQVALTSPCHQDISQPLGIQRGKEQVLELELFEQKRSVKVSAQDEAGKSIGAEVYLGSTRMGTTPCTISVSACAKELKLKSASHGQVVAALSQGGRPLDHVQAILRKPRSKPTPTWASEGNKSTSRPSKGQSCMVLLQAGHLGEAAVDLEIVAAAAIEEKGCRVISRSDVQAVLGMEKMKDVLQADDVSVMADIGGALGVDSIINIRIGKIGSTCLVSASLIDISRAEVKSRARSRSKCNPEALLAVLQGSVPDQLFPSR
jgi:hypothetical protein